MADTAALIQSGQLGIPHGFLTAAQSDGEELDLVGGVLPTVWLAQVHSARVVEATSDHVDGPRIEADAMVTAEGGLRLAIVTADCAPVLLADEQAGVIGAAHAGWRGAHAGVLENTVAAMAALGARPDRIGAAIGPCIAQASYEVDEGFRAKFVDEADQAFFASGAPGHYQFDLEAYASHRLGLAGIERIDPLGLDTYSREDEFHSYRRATHRNTPGKLRQYSLIALQT